MRTSWKLLNNSFYTPLFVIFTLILINKLPKIRYIKLQTSILGENCNVWTSNIEQSNICIIYLNKMYDYWESFLKNLGECVSKYGWFLASVNWI
jgi:hypothetical protein